MQKESEEMIVMTPKKASKIGRPVRSQRHPKNRLHQRSLMCLFLLLTINTVALVVICVVCVSLQQQAIAWQQVATEQSWKQHAANVMMYLDILANYTNAQQQGIMLQQTQAMINSTFQLDLIQRIDQLTDRLLQVLR